MTHKLVQLGLPPDIAAAHAEIGQWIDDGHVTGYGAIILLKRRRYIVDCWGDVCNDPTLGRGCLATLDDCLREMLHKRYRETQTGTI
ncbi:MAG: hypothetical protein H0W48_00220 [Methylibium sp.]|nr:hypothetical protein [Methylibium sp.]